MTESSSNTKEQWKVATQSAGRPIKFEDRIAKRKY